MSQMSHAMDVRAIDAYSDAGRVLRRTIIFGLIAFLTVVDLFATQAILPSLAQAYRVSPAAMSFAVNASTMGMAVAGFSVAFFSRQIGRRSGILISLCVLAVPTALLTVAPDLTTFTLLLGRMALGFVYFVFLPSILTTPFAGAAARRFGTRPTFWCALALAGLGLPLLLLPSLLAVIVGLMLVGIGTFFAQATATGFVGQAATADRGSASGIYLACYFFGGLVGTAVLGQIFDRFGWWACVVGIALALATAAYLAIHLRLRCDESTA
jgi:MFS family permease